MAGAPNVEVKTSAAADIDIDSLTVGDMIGDFSVIDPLDPPPYGRRVDHGTVSAGASVSFHRV